jgi:hypothetical protein
MLLFARGVVMTTGLEDSDVVQPRKLAETRYAATDLQLGPPLAHRRAVHSRLGHSWDSGRLADSAPLAFTDEIRRRPALIPVGADGIEPPTAGV